MSCKPLKIKEQRKQVPCQEGFRGIRSRILIANEQLTELIQSGKASVQVLTSPDQWYGVTYAADKPVVVAALKVMTDGGKYPDGLWK